MNQLDPRHLRCHIDAPASFIPKARYALESLLQPLNARPVWVDGDADLYYGPELDSSSARVRIALHASTREYFGGRERYDVQRVVEADALRYLFGTSEAPDPIASTFFFLSGWDEYVTVERDEHARFCHAHALLKELGEATNPLVDRYRLVLKERLAAAGIELAARSWDGHAWAFMPTFDIDYLREWRPGILLSKGLRRPHAVVRSLLTGADAYLDGVHNLLAALAREDAAGTFFFKATDRSAYDPAYRRSEEVVRHIVGMVREQGSTVGLHPGYYGATHPHYLQEEHQALERLTGEPVRLVRQHYLRYEMPHTSRLHDAEGFAIDSTLGFPDHEGFRRGTCHPFRVFDIERNDVLNVWELPLCFMDSAMVARRGRSAAESAVLLDDLMRTCKAVGGACVALWHNTLWVREMEGWPRSLSAALQRAREQGAWIGGLRVQARSTDPSRVR